MPLRQQRIARLHGSKVVRECRKHQRARNAHREAPLLRKGPRAHGALDARARCVEAQHEAKKCRHGAKLGRQWQCRETAEKKQARSVVANDAERDAIAILPKKHVDRSSHGGHVRL